MVLQNITVETLNSCDVGKKSERLELLQTGRTFSQKTQRVLRSSENNNKT